MAITVGNLKADVSFFLQQEEASFVVGGRDHLLAELNAARRILSQLHDFVAEEDVASVSVSPTTGGTLDETTTISGNPIKSIRRFYLSTDGGEVPILHEEKDLTAIRQLEKDHAYTWDYDTIFRPDEGFTATYQGRRPRIYLYGNVAYLTPAPSAATTVTADVYIEWSDWTGDSDTDWFTDHAGDYLKWATIERLNPRTGTFVNRNEGTPTLSAIEKMKNDAFVALKQMDIFRRQKGRLPLVR